MDSYQQPPAIVEITRITPPYCGRLARKDPKNANSKFPIEVVEAQRLLPDGKNLENKLMLNNPQGGDSHSYIFIGYSGSDTWEIIIAYRTKDGQPQALYHIGSDLFNVDKDLDVPTTYDTTFRFKENPLDVRSRINWNILEDFIRDANYTCYSEDRKGFDKVFRKYFKGPIPNQDSNPKAPQRTKPMNMRLWNQKMPQHKL